MQVDSLFPFLYFLVSVFWLILVRLGVISLSLGVFMCCSDMVVVGVGAYSGRPGDSFVIFLCWCAFVFSDLARFQGRSFLDVSCSIGVFLPSQTLNIWMYLHIWCDVALLSRRGLG